MNRNARSPSPRAVQIHSPMHNVLNYSPRWNTNLEKSTTPPGNYCAASRNPKHLSLRAMFANKFTKNSAENFIRQNEFKSDDISRSGILRAVSASPLTSDNEAVACQKSTAFEEKMQRYANRTRGKYKSAPLSPVRKRLQRQMATHEANAVSVTPPTLSYSAGGSFEGNTSQHRCICQPGLNNMKPALSRWYFIKRQHSYGETKPKTCSRW